MSEQAKSGGLITRRRIFIGLAGVFVLCIVCAAFGALVDDGTDDDESNEIAQESIATATAAVNGDDGGPTGTPEQPSATSVPTDTAEPSATPAPTNTPAPTDTPAPPATNTVPAATSTPDVEATLTALPSPTPAPADTAGAGRLTVTEYADAIYPIMLSYSEALDTLGQRMTAAGEDPALILNEEWTLSVALALARMQTAGEDLRDITPPSDLQDIHNELLTMADHYDAMREHLITGIDNVDQDELLQAMTEMQAGTEALNRAAEQLNAYVDQ